MSGLSLSSYPMPVLVLVDAEIALPEVDRSQIILCTPVFFSEPVFILVVVLEVILVAAPELLCSVRILVTDDALLVVVVNSDELFGTEELAFLVGPADAVDDGD